MSGGAGETAAPGRVSHGDLVELGFLEAVNRRCPGDERILKALGDRLTAAGRYKDGLVVDLELVRLEPADPLVWYNLGCSYARTGRPDQAVQSLERAVALGYEDGAWMARDEDLQSLAEDERFRQLLRRLRGAEARPS